MTNIKHFIHKIKNFCEIFGDGDLFFGVIVLYAITLEFTFFYSDVNSLYKPNISLGLTREEWGFFCTTGLQNWMTLFYMFKIS